MKISGFENVICVEQFEYCANVDEHEYCDFSCSVKEENIDFLVGLVDSDIMFEDDDFKFCGHVTEISFSKDICGCRVEVKTIGKTYLYDQIKCRRIFQNEEKIFSDILSHMESMSDVKVEEDPNILEVVFQDEETDWEFISRMCQVTGLHLFTGNNVYIGRYGKNTNEIQEEDCIDYWYSTSIKGKYLFCRLKQCFSLGDKVRIFDEEFWISKKKYILEKEKYYFEYTFNEITEGIDNDGDLPSVYLDAVVTDNNDPDKKGRIQVSFETDDVMDCMKDNPIWIERLDLYASKGLGTVFIPNVNDKVRIHLYKGKAYVIGSMREEAYGNQYQDCNNKYLILSENISFEYKEGIISAINKENKVEISEESISIYSGEKTICVIQKDCVDIQVEDSTITINSDISLKTGKVVSEAKKDTSISALNVNILGKKGVSIN